MRTTLYLVTVSAILAGCGSGDDSAATDAVPEPETTATETETDTAMQDPSPIRRINRDRNRRNDTSRDAERVRTFDGSDNNRQFPAMNLAHTQLVRWLPVDYGNLVDSLAGLSRPEPRMISNIVSAQVESVPNPASASDYLWQWGQFIDHDLDLTDGTEPAEPADISIPAGDAFFDPDATGTVTLSFNRALYDEATGTSIVNPREQLNEITGWIDASHVYGSDIERATALRTNDGTGKLAISAGDLLPFNIAGLANAGGSGAELFLAGDVRANEQLGLTVMHTLFVREHNRLAEAIMAADPALSGEDIFQRARRIVGAQMQVITYREFLPLLLGEDALPRYRGYDATVDAGIANVFSAASFRLGHSMLSAQVLRLDANGDEIPSGHLPLRDAFFAPQRLAAEGGIEPMLRGLAAQVSQRIDVFVVDDVRNFLFGQPGAGGFDLASINIQRGRDHGLPGYAQARATLGLSPNASFADVTSSLELQDRLATVYDSPDDMDIWVAGLSEDPVPGSMLGELFHTIVSQQFLALRDGDRFWYERILSDEDIAEVEATTLADIIRRNTSIGAELPDNVFVVE